MPLSADAIQQDRQLMHNNEELNDPLKAENKRLLAKVAELNGKVQRKDSLIACFSGEHKDLVAKQDEQAATVSELKERVDRRDSTILKLTERITTFADEIDEIKEGVKARVNSEQPELQQTNESPSGLDGIDRLTKGFREMVVRLEDMGKALAIKTAELEEMKELLKGWKEATRQANGHLREKLDREKQIYFSRTGRREA